MTHRQECIAHCKEQLENRNLEFAFEEKIFNYYYNKNNGTQGNAFLIGIKTADMMIEQYQPKTADENFYNQFFD